MKQPLRVHLLAPLLLLAAGSPLAAQQAASEETALEQIADALSRIAGVMERQLAGDKLDLMMKRVEAGQRRVEQIERQLFNSRREYETALQERTRMETRLASVAEYLESDGVESDPGSMLIETNQMEVELELTRSRVASLEALIVRLENELSRRQREVEDWQNFLDRELSDLQ